MCDPKSGAYNPVTHFKEQLRDQAQAWSEDRIQMNGIIERLRDERDLARCDLNREISYKNEVIEILQKDLHDLQSAREDEVVCLRYQVERQHRDIRRLTEQLAEARAKSVDCVSRKHFDQVNEANDRTVSRLVQEAAAFSTRLFYADRFAERLNGYLQTETQARNEAREELRELKFKVRQLAG
jgi:uncharacterized protein YicC (UPF0701 family)